MGSKKSSTEKTTNITTNTSTRIRDVGLTGQNALDLASILEQGGIEREEIALDRFEILANEQGAGFSRLVGGASDLITAGDRLTAASERTGARILNESGNVLGFASDNADSLISRAVDFGNRLVKSGETSGRVAAEVQSGKEVQSDLVRLAPFVAVAAVALIPLILRSAK